MNNIFGHRLRYRLVAAILVLCAASADGDYARGLTAAKSGDYERAYKEWRTSADAGDAPSQFNLAIMYRTGRGVVRDDAEAVRWCQKAAEAGLVNAQHELGLSYEDGKGIAKNQHEANKWFRRATEQGFPPAQFSLGLSYERGRGVRVDEVEAASWYRRAAEQNYSSAQENLASMYWDGRGVSQNPVLAYVWMSLALEHLSGLKGASQYRLTTDQALAEKYRRSLSQTERDHAGQLIEKYRMSFKKPRTQESAPGPNTTPIEYDQNIVVR